MDFLKRNSGKLALLAIIVFFTLPFIYGNEEEEDFSPFAVKSGMSYQTNPISQLANRIASFYGFSKPASSEIMASNGPANAIKGKVADHMFAKENIANPNYKQGLNSNTADRSNSSSGFNNASNQYRGSDASSQNGNSIRDEVLMASAQRYKNFDKNSGFSGSSNSQSFTGGASSNYQNNFSGAYSNTRSNNPIKGTVQINGQRYNVIEDAKGEKYIVTPRGHVPYKEVVQKSFSEKQFLAAKKRLGNVSDMEVLQELQRERAQREGANPSSANYTQSVTGYKNGTASAMGGNTYATVSTDDTGFNDDVLSNAYADLSNINLREDLSSASSGGGYSGNSYRGGTYSGSAMRDSFGSSSNPAADTGLNGEQGGNVFTPTTFANQVRAQAQEEVLSARAGNSNPQSNEPQEEQNIPEQNLEQNDISGGVQTVYKVEDNDEGEGNNNKNSYTTSNKGQKGSYADQALLVNGYYAQEWGNLIQKATIDGKEGGFVLPVTVDTESETPSIQSRDADNSSLNDRVNEMNNTVFKLFELKGQEIKIYIDKSESDDLSMKLIQAVANKSEGRITLLNLPPKDGEGIILPGLKFTPTSFEQFDLELTEIIKQNNLNNEQN